MHRQTDVVPPLKSGVSAQHPFTRQSMSDSMDHIVETYLISSHHQQTRFLQVSLQRLLSKYQSVLRPYRTHVAANFWPVAGQLDYAHYLTVDSLISSKQLWTQTPCEESSRSNLGSVSSKTVSKMWPATKHECLSTGQGMTLLHASLPSHTKCTEERLPSSSQPQMQQTIDNTNRFPMTARRLREWPFKTRPPHRYKDAVHMEACALNCITHSKTLPNRVVPNVPSCACLEKIPNLLGDYVCRLCGVLFRDAYTLAGHRCPHIAHMDYRCPECSKIFNCPANLASHRRWHKPRDTLNSAEVHSVKQQSGITKPKFGLFCRKRLIDLANSSAAMPTKSLSLTEHSVETGRTIPVGPPDDDTINSRRLDSVYGRNATKQPQHCREHAFSVRTILGWHDEDSGNNQTTANAMERCPLHLPQGPNQVLDKVPLIHSSLFEPRKSTCQRCHATFNNQNSFEAHMLHHVIEQARVHSDALLEND
ncbi:unnamed protein product [Dicrocoelium dendriticum]|nr:unnamed protein product [Dicrocoelium dendriticum]